MDGDVTGHQRPLSAPPGSTHISWGSPGKHALRDLPSRRFPSQFKGKVYFEETAFERGFTGALTAGSEHHGQELHPGSGRAAAPQGIFPRLLPAAAIAALIWAAAARPRCYSGRGPGRRVCDPLPDPKPGLLLNKSRIS